MPPRTLAETAMLEEALALAAQAHKGQKDKAQAPYILHPLRVMLKLGADATLEAQTVAMLHDVVEDAGVTLTELRDRGFPETVVEAVDCLTRRKAAEESYDTFIARVATNPLAVKVKLADLADNLDGTRLVKELDGEGLDRMNRYVRARERLLNDALASPRR